MSLISHTSRDAVTIERLSTSQSATGGQVRSYGVQNRGALPTELRCRIQPVSTEERVAFGIRGTRAAWKLLFSSDPAIASSDRVTFLDADRVARIASVVQSSLNLDGQSRLYRAVVEEVGNEQ